MDLKALSSRRIQTSGRYQDSPARTLLALHPLPSGDFLSLTKRAAFIRAVRRWLIILGNYSYSGSPGLLFPTPRANRAVDRNISSYSPGRPALNSLGRPKRGQ